MYLYSYVSVSYCFITRQWDNTLCHRVLWCVGTDGRIPSLITISAPFLSFTRGTAANWDQPQSQLAKHYKYVSIDLCIRIYIPIYVKRILGAAFNAFGCWKVPERGKKKVEKKGKNRKISGIKFHNTANSFFASLKKKKRKKARCCYIFATTINSLSPSAPHPSLITHLDISKEKHAQLEAEIHQADKMNKHRLDREIKYNANQ